jgi:hypothetical protein
MEQEVLEYFEAYFGETLNESTSDEDIMDAVYDLVELTEAVLESVGGNFGKTWDIRTIQNKNNKEFKPMTAKDILGISGFDTKWNNDKTWSGKGKKVNKSDYLKM